MFHFILATEQVTRVTRKYSILKVLGEEFFPVRQTKHVFGDYLRVSSQATETAPNITKRGRFSVSWMFP